MSLVDYDSSDESSNEEKEKIFKAPLTENKVTEECDDHNDSKKGICSSLPRPKDYISFEGKDTFQNSFLKGIKKEGGGKNEPAKITVPSLSDFDDCEDGGVGRPKAKKIKPSGSSVGLFDVLPPPKNSNVKEANRVLLPHAVKNKLTKPKMKVSSTTSNEEITENNKYAYFSVDFKEFPGSRDHDETSGSSYFGEGIANSSQSILSDHGNQAPYTPVNAESDAPSRHLPDEEGTVNLPESSWANNLYPHAEYNDLQQNNGTLELDDKAMQILCGGRRKRNQMPVNIIDLYGEEIMPDSKEWLLKQLTEEQNVRKSSQKKSNGPSIQSRRKHQITYLAYQAKAQELELQNQWSINRMSRRQTQSKYGF